MELPDVAKIERLSMRPGDRLVVTVTEPLDEVELEALRDVVGKWGIPEGSVIVLGAGMSLQVLEAT